MVGKLNKGFDFDLAGIEKWSVTRIRNYCTQQSLGIEIFPESSGILYRSAGMQNRKKQTREEKEKQLFQVPAAGSSC